MTDSDQPYNYTPLAQPLRITEQYWPEETVPLVSISCTVYNQKAFIEPCLRGFLKQETTFPVEILVHDDASTDGTPEVLRQWERAYPSLIRLTCQKVNQFSQGKSVNFVNWRKARGEYIALCHGDDYWIDSYKLEKQVEVMRSAGVSICGHPAKVIDVEGRDLGRLTGLRLPAVSKIDPAFLIRSGGNMLPFGSIMFTHLAKDDMLAHMPPVMFHTGVQMLGALAGGLIVMPDIMSTYRVNVPGSTTELLLSDPFKQYETTLKRLASIKYLKKIYGKRYWFDFDILLARQVVPFLLMRMFREAANISSRAVAAEPLKTRLLILATVFPLCFRFWGRRFLRFLWPPNRS